MQANTDSTESGFGCLLRAIGNSQQIIDRATVYPARCGRRRFYLSQSDADAYDRGYEMYPHMPAVLVGPERTGWFDAEHEQQSLDEQRSDEQAEEERQ